MAITTTWSVNDMTHKDSDGGVFLVYWSLTATDGTYSAKKVASYNALLTLLHQIILHMQT